MASCSVASAGTIRFPLVAGGKPVASVVVAGSDEILLAAANDLRDYVRRISGAELKIVNQADDLPGPTLHLGETALFEKSAEARKSIYWDGFVMASMGEDLLIAGNMPHGVYTLLQYQFGVHWFFPGVLWEVVPERADLTIQFEARGEASAWTVENPAFAGRSMWGNPFPQEFMRRLRLTPPRGPLPCIGTGHHLTGVIPVEKYGAEHPEYWALINSQRQVEPDTHYCFTNPDLPDLFMEAVRGGQRSFGVNDNTTVCKCKKCLEVDGGSESYNGIWNISDSYFHLIKQVADRTAEEFPGDRLGVLAYQVTNVPPRTVDYIGENVDVLLCQDTSQHFDADYRDTDRIMALEWVGKVGGVSFYDYVGLTYWTPRYFPHILDSQLQFLADIGVKGYTTHIVTMADSAMPMIHLLQRELWDPSLDADQVIDTMLAELYGESAEPIWRFYRHWEDCWQRQSKGRWLFGINNFRGEMTIYRPGDFRKGQAFLDQAVEMATDPKVRERLAFLQKDYAFTMAAANAHFASMEAIHTGTGPRDRMVERSSAAATAWEQFAEALADAETLAHTTPGTEWHPKAFRTRAWGLKQQMRDAVLAPLVRWINVNEIALDAGRLQLFEGQFADVARENLARIEGTLIEPIGAAVRPVRIEPLRPAAAKALPRARRLAAGAEPWPESYANVAPWVFRARPEQPEIGKYDEPLVQNIVDPPAIEDLSVRWQPAWVAGRLYLRLEVQDDVHVQGQEADAMWREDSLQVAINPKRGAFDRPDASSWDFMWGGYQGPELEFGLSLHAGRPQKHVWHAPDGVEAADAVARIEAAAARHGDLTVYEIAIPFELFKDFHPEPQQSLGVAIVVNDVDGDDDDRLVAEFGSGVTRAKRTTTFGAVRLMP